MAAAPVDDELAAQRSLLRTLDGYERKPTAEVASAARDAFARIDSQLAALKRQAAESLGGARAEAEIDRLELQRWRDAQMERFSGAQERINTALMAFDAISKSIAPGDRDFGAGSALRNDRRPEARAGEQGLAAAAD
jgi:hypothetical protein